jgi:hypothetical protein
MVNVIENWSQVTGTIRTIEPDPELPDHVLLTVEIDSVDPVQRESGEHFPNLLARTLDQTVELTLRADAAARGDVRPGKRISARVQLFSPSRLFIDPLHVDAR